MHTEFTMRSPPVRSLHRRRRTAIHPSKVMDAALGLILALSFHVASAAEFNQNAGAVTSANSCDALLKSEEATGGQMLVPNPNKLTTLFTIKRPFAGDRAS